MRTPSDTSLATALFPLTLQRVLAALYMPAGQTLHLRGVVQKTAQSPGTVQRVLDRLTAAGILLRERQGRQVMYKANPLCPIYPELQGLVTKTIGQIDPVRPARNGYASGLGESEQKKLA